MVVAPGRGQSLEMNNMTLPYNYQSLFIYTDTKYISLYTTTPAGDFCEAETQNL